MASRVLAGGSDACSKSIPTIPSVNLLNKYYRQSEEQLSLAVINRDTFSLDRRQRPNK
jgi:hypothetical protein